MPSIGLRQHLRALTPTLILLYAPVLALLIVVVALRIGYAVPMANLTRDPAQVLGVSPFAGAVSNIGILLWCASTAICLFAALLARRHGARRTPIFLLAAGTMTLVLLLDDLFLLHDIVLPKGLGISEEAVYAGYAAMIGAFITLFHRDIRASDYPLLGLALAFFAASLGFDMLQQWVTPPGAFLLEDGSKLMGIVSWAGYLIRTASARLKQAMPVETRVPESVTAGT